MGKKRVLVSYGVDIDAVAGWLGSYGGEDSTSDISRGKHKHHFALPPPSSPSPSPTLLPVGGHFH
jgi:hypothetical protein